MLREWQVIAARQMLDTGRTVRETAGFLRISERSVRKYRDMEEFPQEQTPARQPAAARSWRTREDPLERYWAEIVERLEAEPRLKPFMLLTWLCEKYPDQVTPSIRRSLERRVQKWRQEQNVQQEAMFAQLHHPGDVMAFDFVDLRELGVTIRSRPYPHLMFHAVLTCSNWEYVHVCRSESFESVSRGLQDAFMWAGGVPRRVRSDSLTAAVNNLSADREFQPQYQQLLNHYGVEGHRINVRRPHENGDVESSHGHLKMWLDQALLLRGHRNFESIEAYRDWCRAVVDKKNHSRRLIIEKERECLRPLPQERLDCFTRIDQKVSSESLIVVRQNTYSVNSTYIGLKLEIRIQEDEVELWYAGRRVETMPRLLGKGKECIDYRHIIDSLIRKPGAFRNYRYQQHLFPTIWFRRAWDHLNEKQSERKAVSEYLELLYDAKYEGEDRVDAALNHLLNSNQGVSADAVKAILRAGVKAPLPTDVNVDLPNLSDYDTLCPESLCPDTLCPESLCPESLCPESLCPESLCPESLCPESLCPNTLCHKDVPDEEEETVSDPNRRHEVDTRLDTTSAPADSSRFTSGEFVASDEFAAGDRHSEAGRATAGIATADDSGTPRSDGRSCGSGTLDAHPLSGGADGPGVSDPNPESSAPTAAEFASASGENLESVSVEAVAAARREAVRDSPLRELSGPPDQHSGVWQSRFGEDEFTLFAGGRACPSGPVGSVHDVPVAGAGPAEGQTRPEPGAVNSVAGEVRGTDHRRSGLRSAEPRGDGGALHAAGGTVRTRQCAAEQQSAVQPMGADLQGPDDNGGGNRPADSSFRRDRTQHPQLSTRCGEGESKIQSRFADFKNRIDQLIRFATQTEFLIVANPHY